MTTPTQSFWTILKQTLTEQGKGSSKRVIAYVVTALVCFLSVWATMHEKDIDIAVNLELLGFVAVLLGISAYQQKGKQPVVLRPSLETVNPDKPETPKEPG